MAELVDANNKELEFCWGPKGGVGGSKREFQFYKSCTMDNVTYSVYDCVYLYKTGEFEPYIGKIIKMYEWEKPKSKKKEKKAKILWFFRPSDIKNYLGDYVLSEKEIFLASGDGCGLCNINPLEAIAGKCFVICSSEDERNPQPSKEDLEMADYIFSCTFNVQNRTISRNFDDKIAGTEAKSLFNRFEDLKPRTISYLEENGNSQNGEVGQKSTPHPGAKDALSVNDDANSVPTSTCSHQPVFDRQTCKDKQAAVSSSSDQVENSLKSCQLEANREADESSSKKVKVTEESIKFAKDTQNDTGADEIVMANVKKAMNDDKAVLASTNHVESTKRKTKVDTAEEGPSKKKRYSSDFVELSREIQNYPESEKTMTETEKNKSFKDLETHKESSDKLKLKEKKTKLSEEPQQKVESDNDKRKTKVDSTAEEPSRKKRFASDFVEPSRGIQNYPEAEKSMTETEKNKSFKDLESHKESSDKLKLKEKNTKFSEEPQRKVESENDEMRGFERKEVSKILESSHKRSSEKLKLKEKTTKPSEEPDRKVASENDEMPGVETKEVTKKPESDRKKWFKQLPLPARLRKADEQGTLVFIENLDPSYTSSEIEGFIDDIFNESCSVHVIPLGSFQNPNYGQAYAIFNTTDAADMVVSQINKRCLMQPNGSPLICSKGLLKVPEQRLRGHLTIDKMKMHRDEMKNAVSTSHCSQPNTIEYEMAAEWIVLQEKFRRHANCLYKEQMKELNAAKKNLKLK